MPYKRRVATAYHEAGHVVMGVLLGCFPLSASILPDGSGMVGLTEFPKDIPDFADVRTSNPSLKKQRYVEERVMLKLAGTIAHDHKYPHRHHDDGDRKDYEMACKFLDQACMITSAQHR